MSTSFKTFNSLCAALAASSVTSLAFAQPDPFDDYDRWKAGQAPEPVDAPKTVVVKAPPGVVIDTTPWKWSLGARTQFSFGWASYGRPLGENGTATNLFFRLTPEVSTYVFDRVQVGANAGLYSRLASNTPGDRTTETGMLIELTGYYYAPVSPRFSIVPGLGLGGYFGAGSRTFTLDVSGVEREDTTTTGGFSAAIYVGIAYQLLDHFQLRSGLAFNALLGVEVPDTRGDSLSAYTTHVGIPVELYYNF